MSEISDALLTLRALARKRKDTQTSVEDEELLTPQQCEMVNRVKVESWQHGDEESARPQESADHGFPFILVCSRDGTRTIYNGGPRKRDFLDELYGDRVKIGWDQGLRLLFEKLVEGKSRARVQAGRLTGA